MHIEKLIVAHSVKNSLPFMEIKDSTPCSEVLTNGFCSEPVESNPSCHTILSATFI